MTGFNSNIDELIRKMERVKAADLDVSDAFVVGVNAAKALMQNRIFNQGKDSYEIPLGKYRGDRNIGLSAKKITGLFPDKKVKERTVGGRAIGSGQFTPYELKRLKAGRQVVYKDLEFTGTLRRGIVVLKEGPKRVVCAIPNAELFLIVRGQEKQLKTKIFYLSKREREVMVLNIQAAIKQQYDRLFNS